MTEREKLLRLNFIKELPYPEFLKADSIVQKGADLALLYFWYNLLKMNYHPLFSEESVQKQVVYYTNRNPDFEGDIINWFNLYLDNIKHANTKIEVST